jgi:predicted acyltransferase
MRGLIMVLLALESAGLYEHLSRSTGGNILNPLIRQFFHRLIRQFFHHPWHGLHAWDLVQPAFMFMAGAAMAFSLHRQRQKGLTWGQSFQKTLKRCGWLFFWGVLDYAVRPTGLSFELWDVLTQLSFTTLVAFLVFQWPAAARIAFCAVLLLITEVLYRYTHVPGFDQPFTDQHNFGNYIDLLLMNKINPGGWVAINCIPTSVHTIGGALAGQLLLDSTTNKAPTATTNPASTENRPGRSVRTLLLWSAITLALGYALDRTHITPIIKRIATSSFTLVSLGWSLLILAGCYWWIDVKNHRRRLEFFTIVGMNSIFIYLFFEIVGDRWFNGYVAALTSWTTPIITSLVIFAAEWGLCYFLYKKKIFFRV